MFVPNLDFQLPVPGFGRFSPFLVVDGGDFGYPYYPFQFGYHSGTQTDLPPDDAVVLVVAIISVSELSARTNLELLRVVGLTYNDWRKHKSNRM